MKITTIPAGELADHHVETWSRLVKGNPDFDSPFFHPEFTRAVAAVRDDVEVAVLAEDGQTKGFFPFQRSGRNEARPVGFPMNDFQGIIAQPVSLDPVELLRACGLRAYDFDHVPSSQSAFRSASWRTEISPYMDLTGGFDVYVAGRKNHHSRELRETLRRFRKASREAGVPRFAGRVTDLGVFRQLLQWKRDQYRRTGARDVFEVSWTEALLENLLARSGSDFGAVLSTLHLGDSLAAAHFGLMANGVLHAWFPAYDRRWNTYSPGMILWIELARTAHDLGIRRIDLGKGDQRYKLALMSGAVTVHEGFVASTPVARAVRRAYHHGRRLARRSRLAGPLRKVQKALAMARRGANR